MSLSAPDAQGSGTGLVTHCCSQPRKKVSNRLLTALVNLVQTLRNALALS